MLSRPNFMHGDLDFYLEKNGINIYRCWDETGKISKEDKCTLITKEYLNKTEVIEDYATFLIIEPVSGATIEAHKRLAANYHIAPMTLVASGSIDSMAASVADNVGVIIPQYWMDE